MLVELDPDLVLKNSWLWDEKTLAWARQAILQRTEWKRQDEGAQECI